MSHLKVAYPIADPEARADRVLAWRAPLPQSLPRLAELGYDGVELMVRSPEMIEAERMRSLAESYGLRFAAIGTGPIANERGLTLSDPDDVRQQQAIEAGQAALRLAGALSCCMTIGGFRGSGGEGGVEAGMARFERALELLLPVAQQQRVPICLEPQNRFQSAFYRTVAQVLPLIERWDSPWLGLSLDSFHMNLEENQFAEPIRTAAGRVFYVQVADNHRGAPGTGMLDFRCFREALRDINYVGWVCLEITQKPDPARQAGAAIRGFRNLFPENQLT